VTVDIGADDKVQLVFDAPPPETKAREEEASSVA
jgi:hypothetical protein